MTHSIPAHGRHEQRFTCSTGWWLGFIGRVLLLIWAGFWLWFASAVVISEGALPWQAAVFMLSVVVLAIWSWLEPRTGGILLLCAAIFAGIYFANIWARLLLALPAAVIGCLRIWSASLVMKRT